MHPTDPPIDIHAARTALERGDGSATELLRASLARARSPACAHAFLSLDDEGALAVAGSADRQRKAGMPPSPVAGLAVSIKDLFDVAGQVTAAGSRLFADHAPALADCPAVQRLRQAGAALIGRTNMSEFAFSAIGGNPHHGTPANGGTHDGVPRIPGGSTAGGAVSVAAGAAWAALGSDTGGSVRIPAALQGLVGFKNTARLTPGEGTVPLAPSLDTVSAVTRSVRDAITLHEILSQRPVVRWRKPLAAARLGVPETLVLDALAPQVASAFDAALAALSRAGACIERLALPELLEPADINAQGGFAAAESWAAHRQSLATQAHRYDPRVALRMRRGEAISAADYLDLQRRRADWQRRMNAVLAGYDALLSPTVPMVAPPIAAVAQDDEAFFRINALLLRNPSLVNLLDGCALSLPCHGPGSLPVGLMVWQGALQDDAVLGIARQIEACLQG